MEITLDYDLYRQLVNFIKSYLPTLEVEFADLQEVAESEDTSQLLQQGDTEAYYAIRSAFLKMEKELRTVKALLRDLREL